MREFKSKFASIIQDYLSYRTLLGYISDQREEQFAMFDSYCCKHHSDAEILTKEIVHGWLNYETAYGRTAIRSKGCAMRMLAEYIGNGSYVLPHKAVPAPKQFIPYILTDDELLRLFATADNAEIVNYLNKRKLSVRKMFSTLIRLQYTCGLRPQEARLLKRDNINFKTGEILIENAKGRKERIVVMSDDMREHCKKYDIIRTFETAPSEYFFICADGQPMSAKQLISTFHRCWCRANPDVPENKLPRLRPYDLRHRFASAILHKWINEGKDLYAMLPYLRAYMGHEEFSHTAYYIHLLPENLLCSLGADWSKFDSVSPEVSVWKN